jgi:hypothetical protein
MLSTSFVEDSSSLSSVLGKVGVDEVNQIISDWDTEDSWHWDAVGNSLSIIALVH